MFAPKFVRLSLACAFLATTAPYLVGCGGPPEVKHANMKPGPMPEKGDWAGVYYSPLYGHLHIVSEGKIATGAWRTAAGDAYGELQGEVDGNLMKYSWTERKIGMVGKDAQRTGKGYFVYSAPKEGEAHQINGEWGLGEDEAGNKWDAVKQINMQPNPASVKPDEIESRTNVGGWDTDEGAEKKKE